MKSTDGHKSRYTFFYAGTNVGTSQRLRKKTPLSNYSVCVWFNHFEVPTDGNLSIELCSTKLSDQQNIYNSDIKSCYFLWVFRKPFFKVFFFSSKQKHNFFSFYKNNFPTQSKMCTKTNSDLLWNSNSKQTYLNLKIVFHSEWNKTQHHLSAWRNTIFKWNFNQTTE